MAVLTRDQDVVNASSSRVLIHGHVDAEMRGGIERCLGVAMTSLAINRIVVHITRSNRRLPKGLVAGAAHDGIWLRKSLLQEDRVFLASVLLEEAAHLKMIELGAIDAQSFIGALINEFFGTWYVFYELMHVQPSIVERYDDSPIPPAQATAAGGYALGAFLGAAAAGVPAAQRRIDNWLNDASVDPAIRSAALRVQEISATAGAPLEMAIDLAEKFPRLEDTAAAPASGADP